MVSPTRPRKSFVPRRRPFKMERSRPETVSVRRWLGPRAASTSLACPSVVIKLGQARRSIPTGRGRELRRMETSTGSQSQLSKSPWCARPWSAPVRPRAPASRRASLLCHGDLRVSHLAVNSPAFFPPHSSFAQAQELCGGKNAAPPAKSSPFSCRRRGLRQRLRVYATGERPSGRSWRPGSPAPWPCRISSPCAGARLCRARNDARAGKQPHRRPT
jgi:hypothetical protein